MSGWKGTLELNEPLSVEIMATITDAEYENTERLLITTPSGKKVEFIKADAFRWTPVSEGLPEEKKTVIASSEYGVYPEARYTKENGWEWAYESGADYWEKLECVTAWMPLPEPYDPQESEENKSCDNCKWNKTEKCQPSTCAMIGCDGHGLWDKVEVEPKERSEE